MKHIASPFAYTAAALVATLTLTDPSRADSGDLAHAPMAEALPARVIVVQASSTQALAPTKQAPGPDALTKTSTDNPVEARITALHVELKITQAQEDLWSHVTQVMRDNENTMEALHKARSEQAKTMTAVEDVKSYAEIAGAHADGLQKFVPVFEALYNNMSNEQKKNADTIFGSRNPMAKKNTKSKRN
jgi:LTXXQ motif family protein